MRVHPSVHVMAKCTSAPYHLFEKHYKNGASQGIRALDFNLGKIRTQGLILGSAIVRVLSAWSRRCHRIWWRPAAAICRQSAPQSVVPNPSEECNLAGHTERMSPHASFPPIAACSDPPTSRSVTVVLIPVVRFAGLERAPRRRGSRVLRSQFVPKASARHQHLRPDSERCFRSCCG